VTDRFAVIMAGGAGTRFWPRSRKSRPKQLLEIRPGRTLIQETLDRLPDWLPRERVIAVTNVEQAESLVAHTGLSPENVVREPMGRDTAPCVALAAAIVEKRCPDAAMVVLPADHLIEDVDAFRTDLERAFRTAEDEDSLLTFGIRPDHPATGYGWIELAQRRVDGLFPVESFREKPDEMTARRFLRSGGFLWNSGIFVWRSSVIREEIAEFLPELTSAIGSIEDRLDTPRVSEELARVYPTLEPVSIDRGILQKSDRIVCLAASFDWDDLGSFESLVRQGDVDDDGNVVFGEAEWLNAEGCLVDNHAEGLVALLGVKDLLVVRVDDAVLVARRDQEQQVKDLVQRLKERGKDRYL